MSKFYITYLRQRKDANKSNKNIKKDEGCRDNKQKEGKNNYKVGMNGMRTPSELVSSTLE